MTNKLTKKIMLRIYFMFIIRKLKQPIVSKVVALALFSIALASSVSVPHVLANMFEASNALTYITYAFTHTGSMIKALFVCGILSMVWLLLDIIRTTIYSHKLAH